MKKSFKNIGLIVVMLVTVALACVAYFNFASTMIYEESSRHLTEIYSQVRDSLRDMVQEKWNLLTVWKQYLLREKDERAISAFVQEQKQKWGFTDFYFIANNGEFYTVDGRKGFFNMHQKINDLVDKREAVVLDVALPNKELKVFAIPMPQGSFQGFTYQAIAISYNNEDLIKTLNTNTFEGAADNYVIDESGRVSIARVSESGQRVFNFHAYINNLSDIPREQKKELLQRIVSKSKGVTTLSIRNQRYYLIHMPTEYSKTLLVGLIPVNVVNASMNKLQAITMIVFVLLALLLSGAYIVFIHYKNKLALSKKDRELLYKEQLFSTLADNVDDAFFMVDCKTMNVDYISPNVHRLMGLELKEGMLGAHLGSLGEDDTYFEVGRHIRQNPGAARMEWDKEFLHPLTLEKRWFHVLVYTDLVQKMPKYIIVLSDRTKEHALNVSLSNALNLAQSANKAKSNFLANMSHDIRTPMNAIVGFAGLLADSAQNPEKVLDYAHKITYSSKHLLSLINDILDMSKIESGETALKLSDFSLQELEEELQGIIGPQARNKHQEFKVEYKGQLPAMVRSDKMRINQILLNLLSNAVKYTPNGGHVRLVLEGQSGHRQGFSYVRFVVQDDGFGMSEEFQGQLFTPFTREYTEETKYIQGTGIGMAIVKNIVELLGGNITVVSSKGKGTTFTVNLELAVVATAKVEGALTNEEHKEAISLGGLKVLAAEDNAINAEILELLLMKEGASVEICENGLAVAQRFMGSATDEFDIIFMDVQMPVLDGYGATKLIRSSDHPQAKTIPIVAMTANAFAEDVHKALASGMDAHTSKPVDMQKLKQVVAELLPKLRQK
ncbi:MAG: hybrid sensor histidine kinase/response regulator [Phascolarctobacterium sp.]